jgi:NTE family protein
MPRLLVLSLIVLLVSGCAATGVAHNHPLASAPRQATYSVRDVLAQRPEGEMSLGLTFSGGGTRAAALAYGVLLELRDTPVVVNGTPRRLLDEVSFISSVSGGSFTAAYYGLYGDKIFDDFEKKFLRRDVEGQLLHGLLHPTRWFSRKSRTEMAMEHYQETVFGDATFADMRKQGGPMILINASDLSSGSRITFVQDFFNLLCSDIESFPVAKAVAASSAVPVLFAPVVMENYEGCDTRPFKEGLDSVAARSTNQDVLEAVEGLKKIIADKQQFPYLHLVDGGITDNLGLRSLYEIIELYGGIESFMKHMGVQRVRKPVFIVVNASTDPGYGIASTVKEPTIEQTVAAVSDIQLHRYNASTIDLMRHSLQRWHNEIDPANPATDVHFIEINLRNAGSPNKRRLFNLIPTSYSLSDQQVDELIDAGRTLLRNHPEFKALIRILKEPSVVGAAHTP